MPITHYPSPMLYTVIDSLTHNGTIYSTGDDVELSQAEAKPLLDVKVIAPKPKPKAEQTKKPPDQKDG